MNNNDLLVQGCSVTSGLQASISLGCCYTCGGKEENISFTTSFKSKSNYFAGKYGTRTLKVEAGGQNTGKIYKHKCIINGNLRPSYLFGIFSWVWVLMHIRTLPSPLQHTLFSGERIVHDSFPISSCALFQMYNIWVITPYLLSCFSHKSFFHHVIELQGFHFFSFLLFAQSVLCDR